MRSLKHSGILRYRPGLTPLLVVALATLLLFSTPVAAQAPTGGGGGTSGDYLTILENLWNVVYDTLQYVGLAALGVGAILYFTARNNSNRAETGMKILIGGGALTVFYFGMAAIIAVLEFIATP